MKYKFEITYFVMEAETEETLLTTKKEEVAKFFTENYPIPTVIRPLVKEVAIG